MGYQTSDFEEIKPQWRARLEDALSPSTRGKRRLLLIISTLSLISIILGLFPTKIEALGIVIEGKNQKDLLILLALVNLYALVGFLLYAWADILLQSRIQANADTGYVNEFVKGKASRSESLSYFIRFAFDFLVPLCYGVYALYRLYSAVILAVMP
jgi:signal transduction histidine kinase